MTFVLTGLDIEAKADLARRTLIKELGGTEQFDALDFDLVRSDKPDATTNAEGSAFLRVTAKGRIPAASAARSRTPSSRWCWPAIRAFTARRRLKKPRPMACIGRHWCLPTCRTTKSCWPTGRILPFEPSPSGGGAATPLADPTTGPAAVPPRPPSPAAPRSDCRLGTIIGARSGDKGGNANVGVWARSDRRLCLAGLVLDDRTVQAAGAGSRAAVVRRYEFPQLRALNFVAVGLLGEGVSSSTRPDAQAKSLGEFLRSRLVDLPENLLSDAPK